MELVSIGGWAQGTPLLVGRFGPPFAPVPLDPDCSFPPDVPTSLVYAIATTARSLPTFGEFCTRRLRSQDIVLALAGSGLGFHFAPSPHLQVNLSMPRRFFWIASGLLIKGSQPAVCGEQAG